MDNSFSQILDAAASVLILLPVNPTLDEAAAGLSLYLSMGSNKNVVISCPSAISVGLNRVIGINKISQELGNKNLTIRFKDYDASDIEKVSYDIIDGEFNLTVVPKSGQKSPGQNQVNIGFSGVAADLVILMGGTNDSDFPALSNPDLNSVKIMHIGNRMFNSSLNVMSFAKPSSSVSESVTNLIKENSNLELDVDVATNLVMGIEEAGSNFTNPEVTPETFETFAFLLKNGGKRIPKTKLTPANFPPGSIPTQPFNIPLRQPFPQQLPQMPPAFANANAGQMPMQMPQAADSMDIQGTGETEQDMNPPDDWLQPKVFKGANTPTQPATFSENKG